MRYKIIFYTLLFLAVWTEDLSAQLTPLSFTKGFQAKYESSVLQAATISGFDLEKVQREDELFWGHTRFAAPIDVDLDLEEDGQWLELENGDRLWRLAIQSEGALGLILLYDRFYIPPGAFLFVYSEDRRQVLGAYTDRDAPKNGKFLTGLIKGDRLIVEYFEPARVKGEGRIHIFRLDHAYQKENLDAFEKKLKTIADIGFGTSLACHKNINCPEGDALQMEKRGICRILMVLEEGSGFCTGNLMNNTNQDGTPYILTAFHCQDGYTPMYDFWRFDFNYESPACSNPILEPAPVSLLGCIRRAGRRNNDFLLLESTLAIPPFINAYFLGWNRGEAAPKSGSIIHHPNGDIKKIAADKDSAIIYNRSIMWNNEVTTPPGHHIQLMYDLGTFELGSSGAALLDQNGRVVGQLHGGFSSCSESTGYFGRLALSWEGGDTPQSSLKSWLDPAGTGQTAMDGMLSPAVSLGNLGGKVQMENGKGISGVKVYLSGNQLNDSTTTDVNGDYLFENIPMLDGYGLSANKVQAASIGVSALDLLLTQKHLLGVKKLDSPFKMLSADANASNSITLVDLIQIRKVLLGSAEDFGSTPVWRFVISDYNFSDPDNPFSLPASNIYYLTEFFSEDILDFNFIGFKTGDVDGSANPGN